MWIGTVLLDPYRMGQLDVDWTSFAHNGPDSFLRDPYTIYGLANNPSEGYRNKCEFTFGTNGKEEREVGFRIGRYKDQTVQVESGQSVPIVSDQMKKGLSQFQKMIKESKFKPYSPATYSGNWVTVMMREGGKDSSPANEDSEISTLGGVKFSIFQKSGITLF